MKYTIFLLFLRIFLLEEIDENELDQFKTKGHNYSCNDINEILD